MRQPRIKVAPESAEGIYHCMSRTVNGERLFGELEREVLRKQLWQIADFCGVQVLTYAVMPNHFHVLVRVPVTAPIGDCELLRRYSVLYPHPTRFQTACLSVIQTQLATDGPAAVAWRKRMLAQMGDISPYMKLLKQRFTLWFNRAHGRFGTLWSERFKSLLVEPVGHARKVVAAYIDLNAVRGGLVHDPVDYRFCGYAEAVAGAVAARIGLMCVMGCSSWPQTQASYRTYLFGRGARPRPGRQSISPDGLNNVIRTQGKLSLPVLLRCHVRYFTDGAILGSRAFILFHLIAYRRRTRRFNAQPHPLPSHLGCSPLAVLRRLRGPAISR